MAFNPEYSPKPRVSSERRAFATNDPHFKDAMYRELEKITDEKLFARLHAHLLTLEKLKYRDPEVDRGIIERIKTIMEERGLTESDYQLFLKAPPESA